MEDKPPLLRSFARWLSIALHPFIVAVATLAVVLAASGLPPKTALIWFAIALGTTIVPLLARLLLRYWHVGKDFDIFHRNQRNTVYVLAALCMGALVLIVAFTDAPVLLRGTVYAALLALLAAAVVNRSTKISVHAMVMAGGSAVCGLLHPAWWWVLVPVTVLLGWSRVYLDRHTPVEVILGMIVAVASVWILFPRFMGPV